MDINNTVDDLYSSEVSLSPEIKSYLKETAKWAKFISIVGFVFVGFMIVAALGMSVFMGAATSQFAEAGFPFPPALFSIFYLILAAITAIPIYFLYKFAANMQEALNRNNEEAMTISFKNLKSHYKFYGIAMIIMLGFYALIFVGSILGAGLMM
jgi:hypothetical protein